MKSLTEITVSEGNTCYAAVKNCLCDKSGKAMIACPGGATGAFAVPNGITKLCRESCVGAVMTALTVPESVTEMEIGVFMQCPNLQYADIRAKATTLPENALSYCPALEEVRLSDTVTVIDRMAFSYCTGLETVVLPGTFKEIGASAFSGCSGLKRIVIPAGLESVGASAFSRCSALQDVCYGGTETQWNAIDVGRGNDPLRNAAIQYEWKPQTGDLNGDAAVNAKDVTFLRRAITGGYGVSADPAAADFVRDGFVNAKDVTCLRRYLAGGYGVTLD